MTKRRAIAITALASVLGLLGGYRLQVLAEGAPTRQPLFYSGSLEQNGAPANGDYTLTLSLHNTASGGDKLCTAVAEVSVENGRFRADVSNCANVLADKPDVWVAVSFRDDENVDHPIAGRSKIGAVPYALEAQHAVSASQASGALADQLAALGSRITALEHDSARSSAFQATKHTPQSIEGWDEVVFEREIFDFGDEYNPETSTFTTKDGGYYEFSCIVLYGPADGTIATWEVNLLLNGWETAFTGSYGDGRAATRQVQAIFKLGAGDKVQCAALIDPPSTGPQPLIIGDELHYTRFEGRRFAQL